MNEVPTPYERVAERARLWYGPARIDRWLNGVFEGGGARAVAYPGALEALVANRTWFRSVAGTSAGAITAAFIGSGADASRAKAFTLEMFALVDVPVSAGIRRLLTRGGYFPGDELVAWLDEQLAREILALGRRPPARPVDFQTMFEVSGIETFVVATDLSLGRPIVFSHRATPACGVAEAAVASSSTPLAFESRLLRVPAATERDRVPQHTIVDGGFLSTLPTFVFADPAFRRRYGVLPFELNDDDILAFRLGEPPPEDIPSGTGIAFRGATEPVTAYEWALPQRTPPTTLWSRAVAPFLAMLAAVLDALDRTRRLSRGRWPTPARPWLRHAAAAVSALFGALTPLWLAALVWLLVAGGAVAGTWSALAALAANDYSGGLVLAIGAVMIVLVLPLLVLLLLGLIANAFLLRPARSALYGLAKTYVAATRLRSWEADQPNVIALRVPDDITPVSFRAAIEQHEAVISAARERTHAYFERARGSVGGNGREPPA